MEISDDRNIHTRKLKLVGTSIQETEISIDIMKNKRIQRRDKSVKMLDEQTSENIYGENFNLTEKSELYAISDYGQNEGTEDNYRKFRIPGATSKSYEYLDLSESDLHNHSNVIEKNCQFSKGGAIDYDGINEVKDNTNTKGDTDVFTKVAENSNLSKRHLNNYLDYHERSNQSYNNADNNLKNEDFKTTVDNLKNYQIGDANEIQNLNNKEKLHNAQENVSENKLKQNSSNPNFEDETNMNFIVNSQNDESLPRYGFNVKFPPKSQLYQIPCSSKDITNNHSESNLKDEDEMKGFRNRNISFENREDIGNNKVKKCDQRFYRSGNEIKSKYLGKEMANKSVTDLIIYFKSLGTPKRSDLKIRNLKEKKKYKGNANFEQNVNVDKNKKYNSIISPSVQINPKVCNENRSDGRKKEIILHNGNKIMDEKIFALASPKDILLDPNLERKVSLEISEKNNLADIVPCEYKKAIDVSTKDTSSYVSKGGIENPNEISENDYVSDLNIRGVNRAVEEATEEIFHTANTGFENESIDIPEDDVTSYMTDARQKTLKIPSEDLTSQDLGENVRKMSNKNMPGAIMPCFKTRKSKQKHTPSTNLRICGYCKEKCIDFEHACNHLVDDTISKKEHVFLLNDELYKETDNSSDTNTRRLRSRFTRQYIIPTYQRSHSKLNNEKEDDLEKEILNTNGIREKGNFFLCKISQKDLINNSNEGSANTLTVLKNARKLLNDKEISNLNQQISYMKRFFLIILCMMIFLCIYILIDSTIIIEMKKYPALFGKWKILKIHFYNALFKFDLKYN